MIRLSAFILLTSLCFSAHADLVDFTESTDLPNNPAGAPTYVVDTIGVNRWSGTSFFNQPADNDFDWFIVEVVAGTMITDIDLVSSNPTVVGWDNDLLQQVTFDVGPSQRRYHESDGIITPFENISVDNLPFGVGSFRVSVGPQQGGCPGGSCTASWDWELLVTTAPAPVPPPNPTLNFRGPLKVIHGDNGDAIYSGVPIGTEFFIETNLVTGFSTISDGISVTTFTAFSENDSFFQVANDEMVDADGAALINFFAGTNLAAGDLIDFIAIVGEGPTSGGGVIEIEVIYVLDPLTFDDEIPNKYPPDPADILTTVFNIDEEDAQGGAIYDAFGEVDSNPINFIGQLGIILEDNGDAIYSGVPIGTEFFVEFDLLTGLSSISDGTTVTFSSSRIDTDDSENNAILDADGAALVNFLAGTSFVAGDIVDLIFVETCPPTSGGGVICFWVTYLLDPLAFDSDIESNYPPDPGDILATVFDIEEYDNLGLTIYRATGVIDSGGFPFDEDLISYWSFDDGSASDEVGTNNGMLVGGISPTGGGAEAAPVADNINALRFDGSTSEVVIPHDPSISFAATDSFTLSLWFKNESSRPIYHILGKRDGCSLAINYQLARDFGLLHFNFTRVDANVDAGLNEWVHIASTYDSADPATTSIYVDGVLRSTVSPHTLGPEVGADLKIGNSGICPDGERFQGVIDEVRIYNRALNPQEIAALAGTVANLAPVANAGADQSARAGVSIQLDGTASFDDNTPTEELIASWKIISAPSVSTASIQDANTLTPSILIDVTGTYEIELVVTDGAGISSVPDTIVISDDNLAPTADAGPDQLVYTGSVVTLDGSGSIDPEADTIIYDWLLTAPSGDTSSLIGVAPTFTAFEEGAYTAVLTVSDFLGHNPVTDAVEVTVATPEEFSQVVLMETGDLVVALEESEVTTGGNQNALTNFIAQALRSVQRGNIQDAITKLENALLRTDGCVERGGPDSGSGSSERDWILSCDAQFDVYAEINIALEALRSN